MQIELKPNIELLLRKQVVAAHFVSVEEALAAAVLGLPMTDESLGDLSWAKPFLDEADQAIAQGKFVSEADAFAGLEQRFGTL